MTKSFNENSKIVVIVDSNPTRKGTGRYDRVQRLLRHNNKKVGDFFEKGGKVATLAYAVEHKWVKVTVAKR